MLKFKEWASITEIDKTVLSLFIKDKGKYALLDTQHSDYKQCIKEQEDIFSKIEWWGVYEPILNIAGTEALVKLYKKAKSKAVKKNNYDPNTRDMSEWEEPNLYL